MIMIVNSDAISVIIFMHEVIEFLKSHVVLYVLS